MDRLTYRDANGEAWYADTGTPADRLHRLAAYEETGLEPEEVAEFYRRFCEARDIAVALGQKYADHADELLEAEKQGRLIVLPCKVGDTVWEHDSAGRLYQYTVTTAYFADGKVIFDADGISFSQEAIGTSIFLTREEAEAALERSKSDGD